VFSDFKLYYSKNAIERQLENYSKLLKDMSKREHANKKTFLTSKNIREI